MVKAIFLNDSRICVAIQDGSFMVLKSSEPISKRLQEQLVEVVPKLFDKYYSLGMMNMLGRSLMDLENQGVHLELDLEEGHQLQTKVLVEDDKKSFTVTAKDGEVFKIRSMPLKEEDILPFTIILAQSFDEHFCDDKGYMTYKVFVDMTFIKYHGYIQFEESDRYAERKRIGNRIREIREEKKMKAKYLAQIAGIDASNWSRIEDGSYSVGLDILQKIARALGKKIDFV